MVKGNIHAFRFSLEYGILVTFLAEKKNLRVVFPNKYILMVQRNYDVSLPHNKIPDELCQLVKRLAMPAMPAGDDFKPEAAIVNYFASGIKKYVYSPFGIR